MYDLAILARKLDFPSSTVARSPRQCRRFGLIPGKIPWNRIWQPFPVFFPGKVHGQTSLAGCSPWGYMTDHVCMRVEGDGLVAIKW